MSTGSRIGIACAGGVVEGAFYEIGVLCALEQCIAGLELDHLDVYVGVSAGAIVASCLANGVTPNMMRRVVLGQEREDLNLRPEILFKPAYTEYVLSALKLPGSVYGAVMRHLTRPGDISLFGSLVKLGRALPVGFFDSAPLEHYLAHVFSTHGRSDSFDKLPNKLRVLAVNLDRSLLVAFGDPETAHVPISRAVRASAALPILYMPVEIDGEYYIDGVARRTLNASEALIARRPGRGAFLQAPRAARGRPRLRLPAGRCPGPRHPRAARPLDRALRAGRAVHHLRALVAQRHQPRSAGPFLAAGGRQEKVRAVRAGTDPLSGESSCD